MASNQVIAALQIESNEVRLVVGQFYEDRFDVIAKESAYCFGLNGIRIMDSSKVANAIEGVVASVSKRIGATIKSVLLMVPGYRFKKEKRTFDVLLEKHVVGYEDIKAIFKDAYNASVGHDHEIINVTCANYKVNGISYPKMPIGEKGDILRAEVDLICADKMLAYDYLAAVSEAGLEVIDICEDGYASAKEAALFAQSYGNYVINIHLEGSHTVFSLLYNGRIVTGFAMDNGYDPLVKCIMDSFSLSYKDASRFLFRYATIGEDDGEDRLINRWKVGEKEYSLTYKQLQQSISEASKQLVEDFYECCKDIIAQDKVTTYVTGQGAALQGFEDALQKRFEKRVRCYCPDMLGVREQKWTALLGLFYHYREIQTVYQTTKCSVDMEEYKENLLNVDKDRSDKDLTGKLKSFTEKYL